MNLPSPDLHYSRSSEARVSVEERRGKGRKGSVQVEPNRERLAGRLLFSDSKREENALLRPDRRGGWEDGVSESSKLTESSSEGKVLNKTKTQALASGPALTPSFLP